MADVSRKDSLYKFGKTLENKGGNGFLLSGGCDLNGSVPLDDSIFEQVRRLKKETDLRINLHTGLVDEKTTEMIRSSGIDVVSFDLLGADETIESVLHMKKTVKDYERSYDLLVDSGVEVVPHILAGFHYGKVLGEYDAIDIAAQFKPERAVLIILIPTPGTRMENVQPLEDEEVLLIGRKMRERLRGDLILGCMRPKGRTSLEFSLIEIGFNGVVVPSNATMRKCKEQGWKLLEEDHCCAI